jgi:hypothetical protein
MPCRPEEVSRPAEKRETHALLHAPQENVTPDGGSNSLQWWARSQRIRTTAAHCFEVALYQTTAGLVYQRIAARALHLRQLGLTPAVIARHLGCSDKTATKAIAWIAKLRR